MEVILYKDIDSKFSIPFKFPIRGSALFSPWKSLLQGTCFKGQGNREGRIGWMGKPVNGRERGEVILS